MKRNIDPINRLLRFALFDIMLGGPLSGIAIPGGISILTGVVAIYLLFTILTGHCFLASFFDAAKNKFKQKSDYVSSEEAP